MTGDYLALGHRVFLFAVSVIVLGMSWPAFGDVVPAKKECATLGRVLHDAEASQALGHRVFNKDETDRIWAAAVAQVGHGPKNNWSPNEPYSVAVAWDNEIEMVWFRDKCAGAVLHTPDVLFDALMKAAHISPVAKPVPGTDS